ncbi:MAG: tRNA (cytidine(34)-2'-O)-methyltransferase [Desulfobacterales bacterium]|nr:tRNA (cytidine(34)-2'-O)-methyltransferase [Desulfobacterales bacterium]
MERHVVLVAPDVHWNTGNIGRTCLGAGATLHLIHPLGFSLDDKHLKRAGLDYWHKVDLRTWDDFNAFAQALNPHAEETVLLTKNGATPFWQMPHSSRMFLVFGSETQGLPDTLLARYPGATYHIPISEEIRSLNLSTAAGIVLYESLRRHPPAHGYRPPASR